MDMTKFDLLAQAMLSIKAQNDLQQCYNLDYSKAQDEGRNKFRNRLSEIAFPWQYRENSTVTSETLVRMMGRG